MEAFAAKGHNITFLTPDLETKPNANITYIQIENMYADTYADSTGVDLLVMAEESALQSILTLQKFGILVCEMTTKSKGIDVLRNYPADFKFDLVINDAAAGPCLLFLLNQFDAPLVSITAFGKPDFTNAIIGGHTYDGYTPNNALLYNMNMNFYQRLVNKFFNLFGDV
jgi:glucuronosyltransferase